MSFRKFMKRTALVTLTPFAALIGSTYYLNPELRSDPAQFVKASLRLGNVAIGALQVGSIYTFNGSESMSEKHDRASKILRDAFMRNGGIYIKFGQIIATLDVLVPDEYRTNLETLCDQACTSPYDKVKATVESSLGKPIDEIFSYFNPIPIKSASIAQVHEAVLKQTNEKVAVKVQHQWLKEQIPGDTATLGVIIDIAEKIFDGFKFKWLVEELKVNLPIELDFKGEGRNADRCREIFKGFEQIKVPEIKWQASSDKVLTMEFIDGFSIGDLEKIKQHKFNQQEICKLLSTAFCKQIFVDGFVHSDPHQGNLFLKEIKTKNGRKAPQLVLLDHGIYKNLNNETRMSYASLWKGILTQDEKLIVQASKELGAGEDYQLFASMVSSRPYEKLMSNEKDLKKRMKRFKDFNEKQELVDMAVAWKKQITQVLHKINRDLLLLFKTNDFLRTLDNKLGSPINTYEITLAYCYQAIRTHFYKQYTLPQRINLEIERYWTMAKLYFYKMTFPTQY